jgi:5-methylcytosine-specific restriction endonuclease McrA
MIAAAKVYYEANRERMIAAAREHRQTNKEQVYAYRRGYYTANRENMLAAAREYRQTNKEKIAANKKVYAEANKEKIAAYRRANKEKVAASTKVYAQANPGRINAKTAKRKAAKIQRTPRWLTNEDYRAIRSLYETAAALTKATGIKHHVDHIIPLQGRTVSGLHCPTNLQILTATENCSKNNKFTGDE